MKKTGFLGNTPFFTVIISVVFFAFTSTKAAADVTFKAEVERQSISQDESLSLKLMSTTDGNARVENPHYEAPDFDEVNQYTSQSIQSYYTNGKFGMKNSQVLNIYLRPRKTGELKINNISVVVDGQKYAAKDIAVTVTPAGAGTPPPRQYGGGGMGLRGASKAPNSNGFMVRAEVDRSEVYKGDQIIVSYYLYQRVSVFNIQVVKLPILGGFLKEELEMPLTGQRLNFSPVVVDGVTYQRALLMRVAAYPLKSGKMKLDTIGLKFNYSGSARVPGFDDDDDMFTNLFQQMAPRAGTAESAPIEISVKPLPEEGKPASFTGAVGSDFKVQATLNKAQPKANEAVTLNVKISGAGNLSAVAEPKVEWPKSIEYYESKGQSRSTSAGTSEKSFDILLIPRAEGHYLIPGIEFSYFDTSKDAYVTKKTDSLEMNVMAGDAQSANSPVVQSILPSGNAILDSPLDSALNSTLNSTMINKPEVRNLAMNVLIALGGFIGLLGIGWIIKNILKSKWLRKRMALAKKGKLNEGAWRLLEEKARKAPNALLWPEVQQAYESLTSQVYAAIDEHTKLGARSFPREELNRRLSEAGVSEASLKKLFSLLEFAELVRFASSYGAVSEQQARADLLKWVQEGKLLVESLPEELSIA